MDRMNDVISWGPSEEAWSRHHAHLERLIRDSGARSVCEIGGGANPAVGLDRVRALGIDYTVLDRSASELAKAPSGYRTARADICDALPEGIGNFDLVFTKMLAEHIADPPAFHANVLKLLRPGGLAFHFFPTLYATPFVANKLLPERLARRVLNWFLPRDAFQNAKFPAYYRWCKGPTRAQLRAFEQVGFRVVSYVGFFGHAQYWHRLPPIAKASAAIARWLLRHPIPWLTSFAWVTLERPLDS